MASSSGHEKMTEGVKKINLDTKRKSLKACSTQKKKKKSKVVQTQPYIDIMCPKVNKVPLKEEDHNSWLEFKNLDDGRPALTSISSQESEGKWPIEVDHPFVTVVRDFATDAFNGVAHIWNRNNSLCEPQVMSCRYTNAQKYYYFYMTMEGIERGILGVYKTIVACDVINGSTSLVRLRLTNLKPTGKIAMMLPHLISMRSKHKSMKGMERDLRAKLRETRKDKNKDEVADELIHMEEEYRTIKEECSTLYQHIQSQIPKTWFPRGHPVTNWVGANRSITGLSRRSDFWGRDYCTHSHEFPIYAVIK